MSRLDFPSTARNREPIAEVLSGLWDPTRPLSVLEVASGSGQHATFFARRFPHWTFQPTDLEAEHLDSIRAYAVEAGENLLPPLRLDVSSRPWPLSRKFDAILAINLIHISPWICTEALFDEGQRHLKEQGGIFLYGAFRRAGRHTAPSNEAFDQDLRERDPAWGVRCLDQVTQLAESAGFALAAVVSMPANNLSVMFRRAADSAATSSRR